MARKALARLGAAIVLALASHASSWAEVDRGVIRLNAVPAPAAGSLDDGSLPDQISPSRRGFDYDAFDARLEGLWFQRKAFLAEGRDAEAARQSELIRAFVAEEGVRRLESPAGALIAEAERFLREGSYEKALASLALAESLDPGRPQVRFARAEVLWKSGAGALGAAAEALAGLRAVIAAPLRNPTILEPAALLGVLAILGVVAVFSVLMVIRYQVPFRHEVEEWLIHRGHERLSVAGGWALLALPAILWFAAGWIALYWIAITFRFMRRAERLTAAILLLASAAALPAYRLAVGLYGLTADPMVRTTLAAASGTYDPDRIVKLKELVDSHPDSPVYRFLLAGLYKNGRYLEEAYDQYKQVLRLAPETHQARINIGNIFFLMGQYGEAMTQYRKAIELRPDSALAYYNLYLTQNNAFRLNEAKATLDQARGIDPDQVDQLLAASRGDGGHALVVDAAFDFRSILRSTVEGRRLGEWLSAAPDANPWRSAARGFLNPVSLACLATLIAGALGAWAARARPAARACVRCGRPFCPYCKARRDHADYCSQCVHLFVLGDGLAPETKSRKMYEVERHDRTRRLIARSASIAFPGAGQVLRGRPLGGVAILTMWVAALVAAGPAWLAPFERGLGADLRVDLLASPTVPHAWVVDPLVLLAIPVALAAWLAGNVAVRRSREA